MRIAFKKKFKNKPETHVYIGADSGLTIHICRYCYGLEKRKSKDGQDHANNSRMLFLVEHNTRDLNTTTRVLSATMQACQYLIDKGYEHDWTMT